MPWFTLQEEHITPQQISECCLRLLEEAKSRFGRPLKRVLLLPPDLTRAHSGAGKITEILFNALPDAHVEVIPTLGQHIPHTPDENRRMFGTIPNERIFAHDWRNGCMHVGVIPASVVAEKAVLTKGFFQWP